MAEEKKPKTLFEFIRERIVPINAVIVFAGFIIAALDFLAPRAPYLKWLGISLGILVLAVMLLELLFPDKMNAWIKATSKGLPALVGSMRMGYSSSLRSPAWQAIGILSAAVFGLGQASAAKASEGGILASQFLSVAALQSSMLGVKEDLKDIKDQLKSVKQETSADPRKELVNLGIQWTEEGLESAVRNQDVKAINLFAQSGFSPQRKSGLIAKLAIDAGNQKLIDAVTKLNVSTDFVSWKIREATHDKRVGCEVLVPDLDKKSELVLQASNHALLRATCGKPNTVIQVKEYLDWSVSDAKKFASLSSANDYELKAKRIEKFISILEN